LRLPLNNPSIWALVPCVAAALLEGIISGTGIKSRFAELMTIEQQIRSEIYRAFELLGANRELLGTVGSWGDTLNDEEVLTLLKEWNAEEARREKLASNWF
jgi:hypothetical protein